MTGVCAVGNIPWADTPRKWCPVFWVDFASRQRLIPFKPLTRGQRSKQGSSTLLCKAAYGVPVFFGVQSIHRHKCLETLCLSSPGVNSACGFHLGNPTPQELRTAFGLAFAEQTCWPFVSQALPRSSKEKRLNFLENFQMLKILFFSAILLFFLQKNIILFCADCFICIFV